METVQGKQQLHVSSRLRRLSKRSRATWTVRRARAARKENRQQKTERAAEQRPARACSNLHRLLPAAHTHTLTLTHSNEVPPSTPTTPRHGWLPRGGAGIRWLSGFARLRSALPGLVRCDSNATRRAKSSSGAGRKWNCNNRHRHRRSPSRICHLLSRLSANERDSRRATQPAPNDPAAEQ